ncbi:MAG: YHS domain-containing protein [Chloroflexota bacterium]
MTGWFKRLFSGCCAGQEMKGSGKMAKDPVCGMQVDKKKEGGTSEYKGKTYYFCALGCKKAFDENPDRYLEQAPGTKHPQH